MIFLISQEIGQKMSHGDEGSSSKGTEKPFTALIVDDNFLMRKMHESILKSIGITTQIAHNGKEAIDIFSSGANFDIVFMDMEMPIMNGIEVCFAILNFNIY